VDFYDGLAEIKATFPKLRVLSQHFNHRGAWIERIGPEQVRHIDGHLAVNRPIARALEKERGVPAAAIHLVHHGVALPEILGAEEQSERRRQARQRFGLPLEAVVAGTFVRLHKQKRPADILHLARRLETRGLWFLLAGGGPLDDTIDRELSERPIRNLIRLPMQEDIEPLYDAVDLCLSTSAYEGLPVFLLDGLARGLPVVSTAVGDIPHLLAEGGGLLAHSPGHLDQLEEALLRLRDPELRQREGAKGRRRVAEYFSLEPYRQRYREAIFPAVQGSSAKDPTP
jgi:glycosyltransferase involved in cell wall biosynthesis